MSTCKRSPLVFLFCDVDEELKREIDDAEWFNQVSAMDKIEKQRVALRKNEKGWRTSELTGG